MTRILERKASENEYLHKDFHGALCYAIKYLDEFYGRKSTKEFLHNLGTKVYSPLITQMKAKGLSALAMHFKNVFDHEGGKIEIIYGGDLLTIEVFECPAIKHLRTTGQLFTHRYCETTVQVNKAICESAGYNCSCEYKPGRAQCIQQFWKKRSLK